MSNNVQVDIVARDEALQRVLERVAHTMEGIKKSMERVGEGARHLLEFGVAGYSLETFIEAAERAEVANWKLESTLRVNGYTADLWSEKLKEVANNLAAVSSNSANEIKNAMAYGLQLGITAGEMENHIKAAQGLKQVTGLELPQALRALTLAEQGNFMMLQRKIPMLRGARVESEKMKILNEKIRQGYELEQSSLERSDVAHQKMTQSMEKLGAKIGESLLPWLTQFYNRARQIIDIASEWVSSHEELVSEIVLVTTAILGTIAALPVLVMGFELVSATVAGLVANPLTWIVGALAAVSMAVMYTAGTGNTFAERMGNGFTTVLDYLDTMLGSWDGFKQTLLYLWDTICNGVVSAWNIAVKTLSNAWTGFSTWLQTTWIDLRQGFAEKLVGPLAKGFLWMQYQQDRLGSTGKGAVGSQEREDWAKKRYEGASKELDPIVKQELDRMREQGNLRKAELSKQAEEAYKATNEAYEKAQAETGQKQLDRDKQFAEMRKNMPRLTKNIADALGIDELSFDALLKKFGIKAQEANKGPQDLKVTNPKGQTIQIEDAASMYKRIQLAAAKPDDALTVAKQHKKVAEDNLKIAEEHKAKTEELLRVVKDGKDHASTVKTAVAVFGE